LATYIARGPQALVSPGALGVVKSTPTRRPYKYLDMYAFTRRPYQSMIEKQKEEKKSMPGLGYLQTCNHLNNDHVSIATIFSFMLK